MNLVKKAVMPYKNHRGKVKSIAVIDPGMPYVLEHLSEGFMPLVNSRGRDFHECKTEQIVFGLWHTRVCMLCGARDSCTGVNITGIVQ